MDLSLQGKWAETNSKIYKHVSLDNRSYDFVKNTIKDKNEVVTRKILYTDFESEKDTDLSKPFRFYFL